MYLETAKKEEIFEKYGQGKTDTGSAESQIALFSYRISHLTEHMKQNRKDHSTERGSGRQASCPAQLPEEPRHQSLPCYR